MMRKTAKRLFCIGLALATLFLSACEDPTFEELIPESYGAWEGNYIYRGNVRSKTTGENPERLVEEISVRGKTYDVGECRYHETIDNTTYLTLDSVTSEGTAEASCLVAYELQTKEQEIVFSDYVKEDESGKTYLYRANYIDCRYDDYMIVNGYRYELEYGNIAPSPTKVWFQIDYDGNFLDYEYESLVGWTRIGEEDWSKQVGDSVYYRTWESAPILVCEGASASDQAPLRKAYFVHKNDVKGFLIVNQHKVFKKYEYYGLSYLEFFDISTQTTTQLFSANALYRWVSNYEYEYFLEYDARLVEVEPPEGVDYIFPMEEKFSYKLYRIHYKTDGVYVELIYDFQDATDVDMIAVQNGKAFCTGKTKMNAFGCAGEPKRRYMIIDVNSKKGSIVSRTEYNLRKNSTEERYDITADSGWWNGYYYYIESKRYGKEWTPGMYGGEYEEYHYAYFLYRRTTLTGKVSAMQLWSSENPMPQGVHYCKEMWDSSTGIVNDFVIRSY